MNDPDSLTGLLIKLDNSKSCILKDGSLQCMRSLKNTVCLERAVGVRTSQSVDLTAEQLSDYEITSESRMNDLCLQTIDGLYRVGDVISLGKTINFRRTPGGFRIATVPSGTQVMIVGFEAREYASGDRYYRFQYEGEFGYIYAGDESDYADWASVVEEQSAPEIEFVAKAGQKIKVTAPWGINLRSKISGDLIERVPNGEELEVLKVEIQRESLNAYYQVRHNGNVGYIYGGQSSPEVTYRNWAVVVEAQSAAQYTLKDNLYYRYLLDCAGFDCDVKNVRLLSSRLQPSADKVVVLDEQGDWRRVELESSGRRGWIRYSDLERVQ